MMSAVLTRNHFSVSRAAEYFSTGELQAQTGQPADGFWHVALKELIDNALDAAETAGTAPQIAIDYTRKADRLSLAVRDNGNGIPEPVIAALLDFSTRTSDKAAYRAPTRGAQGNALKTLIGIPVALGDARAKLIIETQGTRHTISVWITPAGEVKHARTVERCDGSGTTVSLEIPGDEDTDWQPERFMVGYALLNPHAQIQIHGFETPIELAESSEPEILNLSFEPTADERWRKFGPTDLTSASWYARDKFERLLHLKAAHAPALSIRNLAREFRGQSRRLRELATAVPVATIGELVNDPAAVALLHDTLSAAQAPKPDILGRIGTEHYRCILDQRYGISYFEEGSMPPVKALVLFFESWYRLGRVPNKFDYELLYRALKEILPAVTEWPKEPVIYWAGKDLNGTPIHQAYVDSYDKFKEYLDAFGPLFDAHDFIRAYEDGKGAEYMDRAAKAKANRDAVEQAIADNPNATQVQIAEKVGLSRRRVGQIVTEIDGNEREANQTPKLRKHGGKREKQADNNKVEPKKFGTDPDYIKTRLARDKADADQPAEVRQKAGFLLAGIERGEVKPHGAAKAMGYVKPKPYKQIPVDSAESAIQALLRVFSRDELVAALMHEERTNEAA
ncbi:MAG: ATP-binding protein [Chromatiaceae bacterium]|nr:ATP-binding protein [Chromatiaceae bacterium]